jgi:CheY-like chemotaxis protein
MDLMMPEMDGLTATREIRKREALKRVPVIALTAKAMADDREQALGAGANDYMAKPFEVERLVSLCRVWLPR